MAWIHRPHAGSDSFGNVWPEADMAIEVPDHQAVVLLGIKDSGCREVAAPEVAETPDPDAAAAEKAKGEADAKAAAEAAAKTPAKSAAAKS